MKSVLFKTNILIRSKLLLNIYLILGLDINPSINVCDLLKTFFKYLKFQISVSQNFTQFNIFTRRI